MGGRVVTVCVFEVVEPFFSVAAAPQHFPSWIRLPIPAGGPPGEPSRPRHLAAGTEYSAATVSRTRGRLNQRDARRAAESKWHIGLASCREGLFFPQGTRADATVTTPSRYQSFSKVLLRAPSVEPERRSSPLTSALAGGVAAARRSCTVGCILPCARRSSPADASPPPGQSSSRDAS